MNLPTLPADKGAHFIYGAAIGTAVSLICLVIGHVEWARVACIGGAGIAGAAKEAFDWYANRRTVASGALPTHDVDPYDFLATLCGGLLVSARP